jgi:hypothetical protein
MADNQPKGPEGKVGGLQNPKSGDVSTALQEKATEAASALAATAQDAARRAQNVAAEVGQRAEETVSDLGRQMQNLAGTIRESGPDEGMMGSATTTVADTLEAGGRYLEEQKLSGVAEDLEGVIRRYPLPAVLAALGLGFLISRATRS